MSGRLSHDQSSCSARVCSGTELASPQATCDAGVPIVISGQPCLQSHGHTFVGLVDSLDVEHLVGPQGHGHTLIELIDSTDVERLACP